jgi:hypothetical protein
MKSQNNKFDLFEIRQWNDGYTLQVSEARPRNAPRYKMTDADRKRMQRSSKMNTQLAGKIFSFDELCLQIKKLGYQNN